MQSPALVVSRDRYDIEFPTERKLTDFKRSILNAAAVVGVKGGSIAGLNFCLGDPGLVLTLKSQVVEDLGRLLRRNLGEMQWPQHAWGKSLQFSHPC
jgi:hypothetical protein